MKFTEFLDTIMADLLLFIAGLTSSFMFVFGDYSLDRPDVTDSPLVFGIRLLGLGASLFLTYLSMASIISATDPDKGEGQ